MKKKQKKHITVQGYQFLKQWGIDLLAYSLCALFGIVGIIVSLHRFWQYEAFYIDFGIFDQAIWKVSQFQPPIIEHFIVGGKWIFADHFSPTIFLLSPLYWFTNRSEVLLIAQAVIVALSGLVLYKTGRVLLQDKLLSFSVLVCYFLFVGLQNAVITEFHELTIMTLPFMLTFWAAATKRVKLYFLFFLLTLGSKEVTFLLGIGIAIAVYVLQRSWKKIALASILLSIAWGFFATQVVIPYFSGGLYVYAPSFEEGIIGKIGSLVDHPLKRRTLFYSFFSFGFLPLLNPAMYLAIAQDFVLRFLPKYFYTRWDLGLHYSAQTAALMSIASLYGYMLLQRFVKRKAILMVIAMLLIGNALILNRFILHGPFLLALNPVFYQHTNNFAFLNTMIAKVPKDVSVMTQNSLAARFTHQQLWILRISYEKFNPDYIVIDTREGQNPNNFFGTDVDPTLIVSKLQQDKTYEMIYNVNDQYIFKRK